MLSAGNARQNRFGLDIAIVKAVGAPRLPISSAGLDCHEVTCVAMAII
ncbi:MAG: hypothetical protein AAFY14_01340 [Pseudomonadota bacterium]